MATDPNDIRLTPQQTATLTAAAPRVHALRQVLERAKRAGLPVEELDQELNRQDQLRAGMLREFGPS